MTQHVPIPRLAYVRLCCLNLRDSFLARMSTVTPFAFCFARFLFFRHSALSSACSLLLRYDPREAQGFRCVEKSSLSGVRHPSGVSPKTIAVLTTLCANVLRKGGGSYMRSSPADEVVPKRCCGQVGNLDGSPPELSRERRMRPV